MGPARLWEGSACEWMGSPSPPALLCAITLGEASAPASGQFPLRISVNWFLVHIAGSMLGYGDQGSSGLASWGHRLGLRCLGSMGRGLCSCWVLSWGLLCPGASCHLWACPWPGLAVCATPGRVPLSSPLGLDGPLPACGQVATHRLYTTSEILHLFTHTCTTRNFVFDYLM